MGVFTKEAFLKSVTDENCANGQPESLPKLLPVSSFRHSASKI